LSNRVPAPLGVFDSGVGGLTLVKAIWQRAPETPVLFCADTAHVPYGNRPLDEIRLFALAIGRWLEAQGCGAIAIGCNLSSSVALEALQEALALPVFGLIGPAAEVAAQTTQTGVVGVIATQGTVDSGSYQRAIKALRPELEVIAVPAPKLVPLVEAGELDSAATREALGEYIEPLLAAGADTIVYGCTHYPWLAELATELAGPGVTFVDPAQIMAGLLPLPTGAGQAPSRVDLLETVVTGSGESVRRFARRFLGLEKLRLRQVPYETLEKEGQ